MINHGRGSDGGNKQPTNWPRKFSLFPQSCWTMLIMAIMEDMLDSVLQDERTNGKHEEWCQHHHPNSSTNAGDEAGQRMHGT